MEKSTSIRVVNQTEGCLTISIQDEDHTLGNAMRYILMKNPDVNFCAYTAPHPSENKIHLRVQTNGKNPIDVLKKACDDLFNVHLHIMDSFKTSLETNI